MRTPSAINRQTACITGKSRCVIESTAQRPMPGIEKMLSVSTAPPNKRPICKPITVITGIRAFRSACRRTTARPANPLARAQTM
jgi:hypothetical protein